MGIFDRKKSNRDLEDEMDAYGLTDEEKELVRNGEYEPDQFEEDPDLMEEGDYYDDDF